MQKVKDWFYNRSRDSEPIESPVNEKLVPERVINAVIKQRYKERIQDEAQGLAHGAARGTAPFISNYVKALQKVRDELNEDEILEVMKEAKEWNEQGLPAEVQAK